jgi:hypothetical protein
MNFNEIAKIVSLFSFLGMAVIVFRKIPALVSLPEVEEPRIKKSKFLVLKEKIKRLNPFKKISYESFLQKIIYKIRILSLKADNKTFKMLQDLKKKALEKRKKWSDNYWLEIKKKMKK